MYHPLGISAAVALAAAAAVIWQKYHTPSNRVSFKKWGFVLSESCSVLVAYHVGDMPSDEGHTHIPPSSVLPWYIHIRYCISPVFES
jgi:hypothetical protein